MKKICTILPGKAILCLLFYVFLSLSSYSQCGLDIYIANDQSGSVDSRENMQSRQFIEKLALGFQLGNANTESRIAISSWSFSTDFQQYPFPVAGAGYTIHMSDIVNYRNSPRVFIGGTDPYNALSRAWQNINSTPVPGRDVQKMIILMTDATSDQVNSNIVQLATQIKANGHRILVLGIDAASGNPPQSILQAVASPGLNFTATDYDALIANAVSTIQSIRSIVCPLPPTTFDLTLRINSFDCNTGDVNYTIFNEGDQSIGPVSVIVSFYSGDPRTSNARFHFSVNPSVTLAPGASSVQIISSATSLTGTQELYAVVNIDPATNVPPLPVDLSSRLVIAGESNAVNNISENFTGTTCNRAVLVTTNNGTMACNNIAGYKVQFCNTGSADASIQSFNHMPPAGFVLQSTRSLNNPSGCSNINANISRLWGTYFGNSSTNVINDMKLDNAGNIYITGTTQGATGIATAGVFDNTFNGSDDGFVAKFNSDGVLQWGTYFGGTGIDRGLRIAVDGSGNIYVAGRSASITGIASAGAFQTARAGTEDAILIKFNGSNGTRLWGTYYGDATAGANENAALVAVSGNDVYLAFTTSTGGSNLTTNGTVHIGGADILLAKFNNAGTRTWATLYGGPAAESIDAGELMANASAVYIGGSTTSSSGIAAGNFWDNTFGGVSDGFVGRFNPANGTLTWSTYTGDAANDAIEAVTIEPSGNLLVAMTTTGAGSVIRRFSPLGGVPLLTATLPNGPTCTDISTDASGNIYVCGFANNVLNSPNAFQITLAGGMDLFFAKYDNAFTLQYSSYYGAAGNENYFLNNIEVDGFGSMILSGVTASNPSTVLATPGAHQTAMAGGTNDGIIAKFAQPQTTGMLSPGCCVVLDYTYSVAAVSNGTHNTSFGLAAIKALPSDSDPTILPHTNFAVPGYAGTHNGFNGAASTTDNIVKTATPVCNTATSPITVAVTFGGPNSCSQSFRTARITITNPNPNVTIANSRLFLELTGTGAIFSGEPYNLTTGLTLPVVETNSPNYPFPGVVNQLNGLSGQQYLTIHNLPSGTSSFDIDILLGSTATNLSVAGVDLPIFYNPGGNTNIASGAGFAAPVSPPVINLNCPGSINAGATIALTGTTTGASSVQWGSATAGDLSNTGTIAAPQTTYTPTITDLVNGYVDISLTAATSGGCDNVRVCRVLINNVQRDFGDAPISFDLGTTAQPVAAASTKLPGLYLGSIDSDVESVAQPTVACDGDGNDEEGLRYYPVSVIRKLNVVPDVEVTNNSNKQAYLVAYIDWNEDGDFLDTDEQSTRITIPSLSGTAIYHPSFDIPFATGPIATYVRLRLSSDAESISVPYGASPEGEVEDHVVSLTVLPVDLVSFKATAFGKDVVLSWQTASETNNDRFEIERSAQGSDWQKIGTVAGYLNSTELHNYDFTDYNPSTTNYYRLKQVNRDGSYGYSVIRQVSFQSKGVTIVYPNPVQDQLRIAIDGAGRSYNVTITNISGQEVLRKNKIVNGTTISVEHLPAGIYVVKLSDNKEQPRYYKVVKQ